MKKRSVVLLAISMIHAGIALAEHQPNHAPATGENNPGRGAEMGKGRNQETPVGRPAGRVAYGKYDLFNQCFVMKADDGYVTRSGAAFTAGGNRAEAEKFYMRAANLARYLFYTPDEMLMTATGSGVSVVPQADAEDGSDWTFDETGDGALTASTRGAFLAVGSNNTLALADAPAKLKFEPADGCAEYPEMPLGVVGKTYKGDVDKPVLGFAEVHTHMANADQLSDGSTEDGAAAGGVLYGHAVDRFGVTHALHDCEKIHGPDGWLDPEALVLDGNPGQTHDTKGWPTFVDWPKHDSFLHQQMYWRWVERAWLSGLRVMSMLGTNIEALCEFGREATAQQRNYEGEVDCKDMSIGMKQVKYAYVIQDYIDAQYGGPGKGFFRIVKDPAEARRVIADGKLAVVPGLEFSNIFGCNVTFLPGGQEVRHCTKAQIDAQIDMAWEAGVRHVYPFHDVDSALGGAGLFSEVLNLVGFYGTKGFWDVSPCENGGEGDTFFYNAGVNFKGPGPTTGGMVYPAEYDPQGHNVPSPFKELLFETLLGKAPVYPTGRQCNNRLITDLGYYAIDKIMKKGFILDIDHAAYRSKQLMLDYTAQTEPDYPLVSGHGGQGGIDKQQIEQIIRQGGIVYPGNGNGKGHVDFLKKLRPHWIASGTSRPFSVGYGADANGIRTLPGPRGQGRIDVKGKVDYPFTLFQGAGWGPRFSDVEPVTIELLAVPDGRIWDVNEGGMYHYGLIPDLVEEIRLEGGQEALDTFYNSAETFLQLWEQTLAASKSARNLPTPEVREGPGGVRTP